MVYPFKYLIILFYITVIILGTYMLNYIQIMAQCKNNVNEVSQLSHFILVVFKYVVLKSLLLLLRLQMGKFRV